MRVRGGFLIVLSVLLWIGASIVLPSRSDWGEPGWPTARKALVTVTALSLTGCVAGVALLFRKKRTKGNKS